jgi:hypothetical protein
MSTWKGRLARPVGDVLPPYLAVKLRAAGLLTVGDVMDASDEDLRGIPALGPKKVATVRMALRRTLNEA